MSIKVLFVDDNKMLRDSMKDIIEHIEGIEVIAIAANGKEAVEFTMKQKPDVIIMDIDMPVMDGIEATSKIIGHYPDIGIVGYSMSGERWKVRGMVESGARGYLLKNTTLEELEMTIRLIHNEGRYFTEEVASYANS